MPEYTDILDRKETPDDEPEDDPERENFEWYFSEKFPTNKWDKLEKLWDEYNELIEQDKSNEEILEKLTEIVKISPNQTGTWRIMGFFLWGLNRNDEAIEAFDRAIQLNVRNVLAWHYKGLVLLIDFEKFGESLECFEKVMQYDEKHVDARYYTAVALAGLKRKDEAIECCDEMMELAGNTSEAWARKADLLQNMNRKKKAIECYDEAIKLDRENIKLWRLKYEILSELKNFQKTIECIDEILALDPDDADIQYSKGCLLIQLQRDEEAVECLMKCKDGLSRCANGMTAGANYARRQGNFGAAIEICDRTLKFDKENADALLIKTMSLVDKWSEIATAAIEAGLKHDFARKHEAIKFCQKIIKSDLKSTNAFHHISTRLFISEQYEMAIEFCDKILQIQSYENDVRALGVKAFCLKELGEKEQSDVIMRLIPGNTHPDLIWERGTFSRY